MFKVTEKTFRLSSNRTGFIIIYSKAKKERICKMITAKKTEFDTAAGYISGIFPMINALSEDIKRSALEIRLRTGKPVTIRLANGVIALQSLVTAESLERIMSVLSENSVHAVQRELCEGFITLNFGHRVGICGTAVYDGGKITMLKNVSSVNLRIARQHIGCAERLADLFRNTPPKGLLIIGSPLCGKTTMLRDLVRLVSCKYNVSIIDTRYEIACVKDGVPTLDVGEMTDILSGFDKNDGIDRALRTLSPQYIATDELGFETGKLSEILNCGAGIIMTAHSVKGDIKAAVNSFGIRDIINSGAVSHIAHITEIGKIGGIYRISDSGEIYA